jgi:hypothetical protein
VTGLSPCDFHITRRDDDEEDERREKERWIATEEAWLVHEALPLTNEWLKPDKPAAPGARLEPSTDRPYEPRTALGRRLWAIRQRIVASGTPLLSADEIEAELARRRGERNPSDE